MSKAGIIVWICGVLLVAGTGAWAAPPDEDDPFNPKADDPFGPKYEFKLKREAKPPAAEPATAKRIDFDVSVTPAKAKRGSIVQLKIKASPRPGFHTYP